MLHTLYLLFIAPLEFLMRLVLEWGFSLTHSWGWSLVLLSLVVNTAILPIYNWAERRQEEERELRRNMSRHEAMLRECFRGQERFALMSALRRLSRYNWLLALRASVGLLLQVPFFIAAWHLLSHFDALNGRPFGPLADLGRPDALFDLGGLQINLLPIAMTGFNLASAFVYAQTLTRRDRFQIYLMAWLFLVLLYDAPSSLTLYWTLNNVYSLCKNIVEKDWMLRAPWQGLREWLGSATRDTGKRVTAIRAVFGPAATCFVIGALFWLYPCAVAFARRDGLLDTVFMSSVRSLAGQCISVSLAAGLVLSLPALSFSCLRPFWRHLTIAAVIVVLFVAQSMLFKWSAGGGHGPFLFEAWNFQGWLTVAGWGVCLSCLAKYQSRLDALFRNWSNMLLDWRNPAAASARNVVPKAAIQPVPSRRDSLILAGAMGMVCVLFLCFVIPYSTYFYNTKEFDFSGFELFIYILPYTILLFCALSLLFYGTTRLFPCECVRLPFRSKKKTGAGVNVCYAIAFMMLVLVWFEGTILSYRLPLLDGRQNLFNSLPRIFFDSSMLLLLFALLLKIKSFFIHNIMPSLALFVLLSFATLLDAYFAGNDDDVKKYDVGVYGLRLTNKETLFSHFHFSKNKNIIILIVDSLDSLSFEKTLEIYPELKRIFNGFWFFRENLGVGGARTDFAVPQILAGKVYDGDPSLFSNFIKEALIGNESMLADARREGFSVFADADYWWVIGENESVDSIQTTQENMLTRRDIYRLTFKFFPYCFKNLLQSQVNINNSIHATCKNEYCMQDDDVNKKQFNLMISTAYKLNDATMPVFSFIHFMGVHVPFIKEDMIQSAREYIKDLAGFFDFLKDIDIYENSLIIVMADHGMGYGLDYRKFYPERKGTYSTVYFPLLLVKMPDSDGDMVIREDLMSSSYVRSLLQGTYLHGATNQFMSEYLQTLPKTRKIYNGYQLYYPVIGTFEAVGDFRTLKIGGK